MGNSESSNETNPFLNAAREANVDKVQALLSKGADVNAKDVSTIKMISIHLMRIFSIHPPPHTSSHTPTYPFGHYYMDPPSPPLNISPLPNTHTYPPTHPTHIYTLTRPFHHLLLYPTFYMYPSPYIFPSP